MADDQKVRWVEVDPIYLTDEKKRPLEAFVFLNHVTYNPALKRPVLRRKAGYQTLSGNTKDDIGDAVVRLVTGKNVRLLAEGISANDQRTLPREDWNPPKDVINGTAKIYESVEA